MHRDVKGTDPLDERGVAQSLRHGALSDDVIRTRPHAGALSRSLRAADGRVSLCVRL